MTLEQARTLAKNTLSEKRFIHEQNVVAAARALALRYGEDPDRAELAGWLHDIVKERPQADLLQLLGQDAIMAGSTKDRPLPVWHGPCAAIYAKHQLNVQDEGVLSAVGCHTTGKVGMSRLDKILMVADMISAERTFPGVEALRALAGQDLDRAAVAVLQKSIEYVQKRGKPVDEASVKSLEAMLESSSGAD